MIQIIPAIDLIDGHCVRLCQGDYSQKRVYSDDPEEMVRQFLAHGLSRIHVVDLDGAKARQPQNLETLRRLASIDGAEIEWGGGVATEGHLEQVFQAGARYVCVGSLAARRPELMREWLKRFGHERMVLGADVRQGRVSVSGWTEDLPLRIEDLIEEFLKQGLSQVVCTDISRDGMLQGPATQLYVRLQQAYPMVDFTVSGGISSLSDIERLDELGLRRVIVGKAIYEGRISLRDLASLARRANDA